MNLFAYGTLMDPEIMALVTGSRRRCHRACLDHYARKLVRGEVYPALVPHHGGKVLGVVYVNLLMPTLDRLDAFEGLEYRRVDVVVTCDDGKSVPAWTYVIDAASLALLSDDDWSYEDFLVNHKQSFLAGCFE